MTAFHSFLVGLALGGAVASYVAYRWGKSIGADVSAAGVTLKKDLGR